MSVPRFYRGELLFCASGRLAATCCYGHDDDDDDEDEEHIYCNETDIPPPCDPYPEPTAWMIGSVCRINDCGEHTMHKRDIVLGGVRSNCSVGFINSANWPLGDITFNVGAKNFHRLLTFKLSIDGSFCSSFSIPVNAGEGYLYHYSAPDTLKDIGAHHIRLLVQWDEDAACEGYTRTKAGELYTWCEAKPTAGFGGYFIYPLGMNAGGDFDLAIQVDADGDDLDGLVNELLGAYDTKEDAQYVTTNWEGLIAAYAATCVCNTACYTGFFDVRYVERNEANELVLMSHGGQGGAIDSAYCEQGWMGWEATLNDELAAEEGFSIQPRLLLHNGDRIDAGWSGEVPPCTGLYFVISGVQDNHAWEDESPISGFTYKVESDADCVLEDESSPYYEAVWSYNESTNEGVPGNQAQLYDYKESLGV